MEKKIEDYMGLYIGSEVMTPDGKVLLTGFGQGDIFYEHLDGGVGEYRSDEWTYEEVKLILRPLSDITQEEAFKLLCLNNIYPLQFYCKETIDDREGFYIQYRLCYQNRKSKIYREHFPYTGPNKPEAFAFLLSKGFDLFGLIESGHAIDKTTLTKEKK